MNDLFERISLQKQDAVTAAALAEFSQRGYEGANINHIAKRARVSVGSLYKYFDNKLDLFLYVMRRGAADLSAVLDEALQGGEDILVKVGRVLKMMQSYARTHAEMIRLYNHMTAQTDRELVGAAVAETERVTARLYTALIEKAQAEGDARAGLDPALFAFFLDNLFMMFHFSYACEYYRERFKAYAGDDIFDRDDYVVEQMLSFIKAAFR